MSAWDRGDSGLSPKGQQTEATRSWWLEERTRDGFSAAAEREQRRMARSEMARRVGSITVGWGQSIGSMK